MPSRPRSALLATLATMIACVFPWIAYAQTTSVVTILPPVPPAPSAVTTPTIEPMMDLKGLAGKHISSIEVVNNGEAWGGGVFPKINSVHAGDALTGATARLALDEVLATGRYARAQATAIDEGGGSVVLQIRVVPRKTIETMRVDLGGATVDRDELLREGDFAEGGELVLADLPEKQDRIESFLARHGYPDATVSLTTRLTDDPLKVFLLLEVKPGEVRKIQKRYFFVLNAPREALQSTTDAYTVKTGDRADETLLDLADASLEARLRAKGYHHADVSHDLVKYGGMIALRVRVAAGNLYLPRFEGNDSYDSDALRGALALEAAEGDLTPQHLGDKIRDYYQKHGFFDVEVVVEDRGGPNDSTHYLVFKILEHPRVLVATRSYPCLKEDQIRGLKEGGPKSATQIGNEIDSYLEEELPGADLFKNPSALGVQETVLTQS
ncbi:MAG: POTRA domain-containing protein, partial [Polyangiaceae bacterium]